MKTNEQAQPIANVKSRRQLAAGLLAVLIAAGTAIGAEPKDKAASRNSPAEFCVAGYLPDYRVEAIDPSAAEMLTDLVYFSIEPRANGELDATGLSDATLEKLRDMKARGKCRLLVTVGGWERSRSFAPMAADPQTRNRFIQNLNAFCQERRFDGVDFDWEHPADRAQQQAYSALLVEAHEAFQPQGRLVTVAMAAWQHLEPRALQAIDRIHLMAYDHDDRRHSTFEQSQADVERVIKQGADPAKICLGLPFYGRGPDDRSLAKSYAELLAEHKPPREADEAAGYYFNGPITIQRKTRYALEHGLAGMMIWELGQDAAGANSLLRVIHAAKTK